MPEGGCLHEQPDHRSTITDTRAAVFWRNLAANIVAEGMWGFGMACTSLTTVLAAFLRHLHASDLVIGLLPGVAMAGFAVLPIPGAIFFRRFRWRKLPFLAAHLPLVLGQFAAAAVAYYLSATAPGRAIALFFLIIAVQSVLGGFTWPAWPDLLNRIFPPERRGTAIGIAALTMSGMGIIGGLYAAAVLDTRPEAPPFHILFIVAGSVSLLSLLSWAPVVEMPIASSRPPIRVGRAVRALLARRSPWLRLIASRWAMEVARAPLIFATVLTLSRFNLPSSAAGILTFLLAVGGAASAPIAGWLGDRRGHKAPMVAAATLLPLGTLIVVLSPHPWVAYTGFLLLGAVPSGDFLGTMNLVIESAPEEDKTIYIAVVQTAMIPPRLLGTGLAATMAHFASPVAALWLAIGLQLFALAVTVRLVVEPRHPPGGGGSPYPAAS